MRAKATQRRVLGGPPDRDTSDGDAECQVECVDAKRVNRARKAQPSAADVATLAETFKTLGDPTRLRIVAALAEEELCVCDIATLLGASQSAVSHSLRSLRLLRLVRYRKTGKIAYYTLDDEHIGSLLREGIRHVREAENNDPLTRSRR
ncbi:MAG: metalloregulator ArsR/SmtB family transcription factor [Gemmatimonadaceae bacterium]